uniref:maturase K n=1 Tax=Asplenium castaneoviride TaxID=2601855 RepID=UPI0023AB25B0|nr:maturase K [Asplenium castaneoviride]YP_010702226.1 maturase K [Asplenium ruprechtii]WCL38427.1 maturase K [Asplenium castaneoviride]WCL38515.1 maturase K [Asplenium castaneoviride]WCL38603.1 maturase K [Asplenium ruprechtii]
MKTTSEFYFKLDVLQKSERLTSNRDCLPYLFFFLFRDNLYSVACKHCLDRRNAGLLFGACGATAIKRSIDSMRYQEYSEIFYSKFVRSRSSRFSLDLYLHILLQTISLILGILLPRLLTGEVKENSKISQSIHSIFLFLEDRLPKLSHALEIEMVQNLHLETSVRLIRRRIKDVSFLHLLRMVFHLSKTSCETFVKLWSWKGKQPRKINKLLRNFYSYEIDLRLVVLWTRKHKSKYFAFTDRRNITRKRKRVSIFNCELDTVGIDRYPIRGLCIHLGRYKNKSVIIVRGTHHFVKKWIYYLSILLRPQFHHPIEFTRILINLLSASCVLFLGYISTVQSVSKDVQVETTVGFCNSISSERELHPNIPILLLVKTLGKDKSCDSIGRPVSKLDWAALKDDDILNRFLEIWSSFSYYYSASLNRDGLRKLRYIPRVSCDNTLASKHKSTIRLLRRRFELELLMKVVSMYKKPSFSKINQRVWYSSLTQYVPLKLNLLNNQFY